LSMRKGGILTCSRYEYSSDRGHIRIHILPITELSAYQSTIYIFIVIYIIRLNKYTS
jgi:hypothetical protein